MSVRNTKRRGTRPVSIAFDRHNMTGTYEASTPTLEGKPVDAKWAFTYKMGKDGLK